MPNIFSQGCVHTSDSIFDLQ